MGLLVEDEEVGEGLDPAGDDLESGVGAVKALDRCFGHVRRHNDREMLSLL